MTRSNPSAAKRNPAKAAPVSGSMRGVITVFILFHLVAITIWTLPLNARILTAFKEVVRPYMLWAGLFQSWDTFAPDPRPVNAYVKAVVITQQRHLRVYEFPRMEQLSYFERYRKERYRKFMENLPKPEYSVILPDVVKYIARSVNNPLDPFDPPDKVTLIQFSSDITPGNGDYEPPAKPAVFFDDYIEPGDLR